ncbi:hypothetical protein [Lactovum odontotermitis]
MKKKIIILLSLLVIALLSVGAFFSMRNNVPRNTTQKKSGKTIYVSASYAIDPTNLSELAGIADNVFVGEVINDMETVYSGKSRLPLTVYKVRVVENIKGKFAVDKPLRLYKDGGYTENGDLNIYSDDEMPQSGNYYVFSTYTQNPDRDLPSGSIVASGMNSNIRLDKNEVNGENTGRSSGKILEFQNAVENQVPFDRERGEIVDSETYFNEALPE